MPPSGGGGGGDSTQENVPWAGVQGPLLYGFEQARRLYDQDALGALGDESQRTLDARNMAANYAMGGGSGLIPGAQGLAGDTIAGNYLTGETNPYLQGAIEYAQQPVIDAWQQQIMPRLDATFAGTAGGMGSGAYAAARERSAADLSRDLAGAATQAGFQNYGQERGRQLAAMGAAPGLDQAGYQNFANLGRIGAAEDIRSQMEAGVPANALNQYLQFINPGLRFGTTTASQDQDINWLGTGAGLAATGLGAASMLCDSRLKTDVKRIGQMDNGVPLYRFRYTAQVEEVGDDLAPYHIGPMAQELEKVQPEAVHTVSGLKVVDVERL